MATQPTDSQVDLREGESHAKGGGEDSHVVDLATRDPNHRNTHLKVTFEDVFAEPHSSVHSFDGVWTTSFKVFKITQMWCYRILSLLFAIPATVFWAVHFAILSCCCIWCCRPFIRSFELKLHCCKDLHSAVLNAFIRPFCEALGFCFYNLRIVLYRTGELGFDI